MTTTVTIEPPTVEFMNFTEIVNDVVHKLHIKDRLLLQSLSLDSLLQGQREFLNHIRNFYLLSNSDHPLLKEASIGETPDWLASEVATCVWTDVRERPPQDQA